MNSNNSFSISPTQTTNNNVVKQRPSLINFVLLKQTCKENWKMWLIITGIMALFVCIFSYAVPNEIQRRFDGYLEKYIDAIPQLKTSLPTLVPTLNASSDYDNWKTIYDAISNYTKTLDPTSSTDLATLAAIKEVLKVSNLANLEGLNNSLKNMTITTISNSITMIGTLLGLVYVIILSNSLIASKVDRGSMAYILSTPIRRFTVSYTQSIFAIGSLLLMVIIIYISQFIVFIFTGVTFDYLEGAISYFGFFLFLCAISSIAFLASCVSNTSKNCLTFGGGIPVVFYVLTIISQINVDLSFVRFFTLNTLFAKETIQNIWGVVYDSTKPNDLGELTVVLYKENTYLYFYLALAIFSIALYLIGHKVFAKKDLPL